MSSAGVIRKIVAALVPATLLVPVASGAAQASSKQVELSSLRASVSTNGWGPVERNRSNGRGKAGDGRQMRIGGKVFATGLGVHAPSDVRYVVPAGCTRFTAAVGVDDEVGNRGSVVFQVLSGPSKVYDSGLVRGSGKAVPVSVAVQPGSVLRLVVTPGPDGPRHDRGDWAAARLTCSPAGAAAPEPTVTRPQPAAVPARSVPSATTPPSHGPLGAPGPWAQAFSDEFDGPRLDETKWSDHDAWQAKGHGSDSAWFPVPHTARQLETKGGLLTLRNRRASGLPAGATFTSAHINTWDKFHIPAGSTSFVEARIKAPSAAGTLPQFWLLGNGTNGEGKGWPISGEVDIVEFANNDKGERGAPYFSVWYPKDVYSKAPGSFLNGTHDTHPTTWKQRPELLDSWHTWGLLRSPERMDLFIDGALVATFRPGQAYQNGMPLPPVLFTHAQHLRLSLGVGGAWAGSGYTESQFREADFSVDYVRVWLR